MNWTYRIVCRETQWGEEFSIHEFYMTEDDEIWGWTENPESVYGDTVDDVRQSLKWMLEACDKPIIEQTILDAIIEQHKLPTEEEIHRDDDEAIERWLEEGGSIGG